MRKYRFNENEPIDFDNIPGFERTWGKSYSVNLENQKSLIIIDDSIDMSKYRSGGLIVWDKPMVGKYVYESEPIKQEQVMDKEYMDVLEYCKLYGEKEEYSRYTYIINYRSPVKLYPCKVEIYEDYWRVKGHNHITTLKQLIDHLDSWF